MPVSQSVAAPASHVNGLNVQAAFDTIEAIKADPTLANFQFRASNTWIDGGTNRSTIRDFYGAGREDDSRKVVTSCLPTVNRRFCLVIMKGPIPSNFSCMHWRDASPRRSSSTRRHGG